MNVDNSRESGCKTLEEYGEYLVDWLRNEVVTRGAQGLVIGLSGGVDSALSAMLATRAVGANNVAYITLPIDNMGQDLLDVQAFAEQHLLPLEVIDLAATYNVHVNALRISSPRAVANLRARLRMATLYAIATERNYLVIGTDNLAEYQLGYFTKFGDGACDVMPIIHLNKEQVRQLATIMGVPATIVNKTPSAALWAGQSDEEELGFTYKNFADFIQGHEVDSRTVELIFSQIRSTQHKREAPATPETFDNQGALLSEILRGYYESN